MIEIGRVWLLAPVLLTSVVPVQAQQSEKIARIGYLTTSPRERTVATSRRSVKVSASSATLRAKTSISNTNMLRVHLNACRN